MLITIELKAVGAASQWWSNERMMVYIKLMMVNACQWWWNECISPSLTSISPSLTSILPSLAWGKPSFAYLTIIEKLHQLQRMSSEISIWSEKIPELYFWIEYFECSDDIYYQVHLPFFKIQNARSMNFHRRNSLFFMLILPEVGILTA